MLAPVLLLVLLGSSLTWSHPQFATNKAALCKSLEPAHGAPAQPGTSFSTNFAVKVTSSTTNPSASVIQITSKANKNIKGYLIQARDPCTNEILEGSWSGKGLDAKTTQKKILTCDSQPINQGQNAIHHAHPAPKTTAPKKSVEYTWTPAKSDQPLKFVYSIVAEKRTFWTKQEQIVRPCKA